MSPLGRWPTVEPRRRAVTGGHGRAVLTRFAVDFEVVTPMLGGGVRTRAVDDVDVIRAPSVRGQLRFWWRALRGHDFHRPEELAEREGALWGRIMEGGAQRSAVELQIDNVQPTGVDASNVTYSSQGAYALWPARKEKERPVARRWRPGVKFRLTITVPEADEQDVRNAVRAWLLFGGIGSRTRRGVGSLTVTSDATGWLPATATRKAVVELFGRDIFGAHERARRDMPSLAGAALHVGGATSNAEMAWDIALGWLKEFRQGTDGGPGYRAREPRPAPRKPPSISNWPEADKVRHLTGRLYAHTPRHTPIPAWPRSGFGLPIGGQFQGGAPAGSEPDPFVLHWKPAGAHPLANENIDGRLASPLIVKALPLTGGLFVPCALWLNRAHPDGVVVLKGVPGSGAPFDRLVAPGDTAHFLPLHGPLSLREAFLVWLQGSYRTTRVAP